MKHSDYDDLSNYEATSTTKKGRTSKKQQRKLDKALRNSRQNRRNEKQWG